VISLAHFPRELKAAQVTKPVCEAFKFSNASLNGMTSRLDRGLWALSRPVWAVGIIWVYIGIM
jgi:hypothetical protein